MADFPIAAARRGLLAIVLIIATAFVGCGMTTRVDTGHVGIRINLAGSSRGVQDMQLAVGWVFYNPLTEQIILFPVSVQNVVWTQAPHEGSAVDESLSFSSAEGVNISADIALSFRIDPALAPKLFAKFRQNDLQMLAHTYMRNTVREAFNEVASKMPVQEIYGAGKSKVVEDVTKKVNAKLMPDGFIIEQLTINGALRLPQNVADAINRAMEATQNAIQSENKVRQVKAEAEQAITKAHGEAEAARQRAQGEGDALLIHARSEAKANEIVRLSMSPAVLQYRTVQHWDGRLPQYNGGTLPMLTVDATKLGLGMDEATREKKLKQLLDEEQEKAKAKAATALIPTAADQAQTAVVPPIPAK